MLEVRVKNTNETQQFTLKIVEVPPEAEDEEGAEESDDSDESTMSKSGILKVAVCRR